MNNLEKFINDLSNYWELTPNQVVDRLNRMDESEIKNVINKMVKKHKNGGMIDCLRNGGSYGECKKCAQQKVVKNQQPAGPMKKDRVDTAGKAWTLSDGTDVLTTDGYGVHPAPGSYHQMPNYQAELETWRNIKTNKGGEPVRYDFRVYNNDQNVLFPVYKYTTKNNFFRKLTGWKTMTPELLERFNNAYKVNGLKNGGSIDKYKK